MNTHTALRQARQVIAVAGSGSVAAPWREAALASRPNEDPAGRV